MKRIYVGIALLALILAMGIGLTVAFDRIHTSLGRTLDQAADAAMAGNWEKAVTLAKQADSAWSKTRFFTAAAADHQVLEDMDSLFAQLKIWIALEESSEFAVTCAAMASLSQALAQSQSVIWWNLL